MQVDNQKLFDYATLESELDAECAQDLAKSFMEDAGKVMELLTQSVSSKDQEGVRSNAHKLRGCCRSINAMPVEQVSSQLEDAANQGDWKAMNEHFGAVRPLFDSLVAEIQAYLNKG